MNVTHTEAPITEIEVDAVVVGLPADGRLSPSAAAVDEATGGIITRLFERKEITGKAGEVTPLLAVGGVRAAQVVVVGLGKAEQFDNGAAFRAAATAARRLAAKERRQVAFYLDDDWTTPQSESGVCGAMAGCVGQDLYRAEKNRHPIGEILWAGGDEATTSSGRIIGESINLTRRLINEPPEEMYPESFAERAAELAGTCQFEEFVVWDEKRLKEERCGALLAVGRGSPRPPRLVMLRHMGGAKDGPLLALVGKGVTFDSGGLSLKPSDSMKTMKLDMSGAATVLGAMQAISQLNLPVNVIGLMGLVENLVSGDAYKLGDVLTARNGKTIEVLNTDAEGRLVLADVLCVAVDQGADKIIDLATLTGACVVALGEDVAGLMSNDQAWCDVVSKAAADCGERAWQLPMFAEYSQQIKSPVADIKNIGEGRWGGAITAAKFLEEFVDGKPWTHVDIAGPAFSEKDKPHCDGGGTGAFVRTLVEVARGWGG
ncbi:MAG: leucyl aminopeptidase [Planctomycetes bacterium]|nr:leucyl aminopeptidase [Planctomycetota bacterium]